MKQDLNKVVVSKENNTSRIFEGSEGLQKNLLTSPSDGQDANREFVRPSDNPFTR